MPWAPGLTALAATVGSLARGYRPVRTYSAHDIADLRLARAIADYLAREREHIEEAIEVYGDHVPFRRGPRTDAES